MAFTDSDIWRYANTEAGAPAEDVMVQAGPCYPLVVLYLAEVEIVHTEANGYRCSDAECPCQPDEVHSPYLDCNCGSCRFVAQMLDYRGQEDIEHRSF